MVQGFARSIDLNTEQTFKANDEANLQRWIYDELILLDHCFIDYIIN